MIEFANKKDAQEAEAIMSSAMVGDDNVRLFGEIDNRGLSLFVTLTYSSEIGIKTQCVTNGKSTDLFPEVGFVAIKNGMHQGEGFAFFTPGIAKFAPPEGSHVKEIGHMISRYFDCSLKPLRSDLLQTEEKATDSV